MSVYFNVLEVFTASFITLMMEVPLKRQSTSTRLHGAMSQMDLIFILAAVRT
jgi:hypothetical protein